MAAYHVRPLLVLVVSGVLLTGCGLAATEPPAADPSPASPSPQGTVATDQLTITNRGFEPQSITVTKGSTVTWTNADASGHWIASDPHPIHTDLAGFDSQGTVSAGGTYQFTFTKVGEWAYHDHLRPVTYTGLVIVTE